jgi:hypothetical protein
MENWQPCVVEAVRHSCEDEQSCGARREFRATSFTGGKPMAHYVLRGFKGNEEVITTTVAIVPGAASYPHPGQTIDHRWKVKEIIKATQNEFHISVEPLSE